MTPREAITAAFIAQAGWGGSNRTAVTGDASNRRYERLTDSTGRTAILMDAPPDRGEDVRPFVRMADFLRSNGLSAPEIYHQHPQAGFLLIEDLGDALFARLLAEDPARQHDLYAAATDVLLALHAAPTLPLDTCDADWLSDMTAPVFDWYAPAQGTEAQRAFDAVFRPLAMQLDSTPKVVILRDYHAENLLLLPERSGVARVGLLDFQDALLGHPAYDLVSVLQDARRDVPAEIEAQMLERYLSRSGQEEGAFRSAYALLGVQRNLRILGIFARLCLRDTKPRYLAFIPRVWEYVLRDLAHPDLSELAQVIAATLPAPTPEFLEHLKNRCAPDPTP